MAQLGEGFNNQELNNLIDVDIARRNNLESGTELQPSGYSPQMLDDSGELNPLWVEKYGSAETADGGDDSLLAGCTSVHVAHAGDYFRCADCRFPDIRAPRAGGDLAARTPVLPPVAIP